MQRHAKEFPRRGGQHATSRTRTTARPSHRCGESNPHLMAFQNTTPQRLTRFTLREAFLALTVVAVFCSLRSWSIAVEDERIIAVAPLVVASMVAALLAMRGAGYALLFAGAGLASLVAATSWALLSTTDAADERQVESARFGRQNGSGMELRQSVRRGTREHLAASRNSGRPVFSRSSTINA